FEAKLAARAHLLRGGAAGPRDKHAAWREPILNAIDRIETVRKEKRERRLLATVERARLLAEGAVQEDAGRKAAATAEAILRTADQARRAEAERVRIGSAAPCAAYTSPAGVGTIMSGASSP